MALQLATRPHPRRKATPRLRMTTHSGRALLVRFGTPNDLPLLDDLSTRLSPETRWLRWFIPISAEGVAHLWRLIFEADPTQTIIVAETTEPQPHLIAVAQLARSRTQPDSAEFAIVVRDDYQREGVGTRLAHVLGRLAQTRGLRRLTATALIENRGVVQLLRKLDLAYRTTRRDGATEITIELPRQRRAA